MTWCCSCGTCVRRTASTRRRSGPKKKWTKKEPSWSPDTLDVLLVDSFETPIARPSLPVMQKKFYSGKKKRHTIKTQIVTDKHGEAIAIETGHPGPKSDWDKSERYKTVYQDSLAAGQYPQAAGQYPQAAGQYPQAAGQYPQAARRGDLGYLGVPKMLLPNKRKRGKAGEKSAELTPEQKAENQHLARQRVYVEHGVRRVKAWRILRDEFWLGIGLFPLVATVGLGNLGRVVPG